MTLLEQVKNLKNADPGFDVDFFNVEAADEYLQQVTDLLARLEEELPNLIK